LSCGRMVIVTVTVVMPLCCCHCHGCIIFTVISAVVVRPWLEKAKCSCGKSSVFGNGYQVQLFGVQTMQLVSKSKSHHFHGMFSFFPPHRVTHSQPLPQLVPPLPHKWHTCTHAICCLVVIALNLPCHLPPSTCDPASSCPQVYKSPHEMLCSCHSPFKPHAGASTSMLDSLHMCHCQTTPCMKRYSATQSCQCAPFFFSHLQSH
jgi:hypothetical protein